MTNKSLLPLSATFIPMKCLQKDMLTWVPSKNILKMNFSVKLVGMPLITAEFGKTMLVNQQKLTMITSLKG